MAYVNEMRSAPSVPFTTTGDHSPVTRMLKEGRDEVQFGYRTNNLTPEEQAMFESGKTWKDNASYISYLEDVGYDYLGRGNQPWMVHNRDYTRTEVHTGEFDLLYKYRPTASPTVIQYGCHGYFGSNGVTADYILGSPPSEAILQNIAGSLWRQSVPNTKSFNLYRAIAEQRDAPRLAKALSLKGMNPKAFSQAVGSGYLVKGAKGVKSLGKKAAESYLTWVFGIKPTYSDLYSSLDAVIGVNHGVRNYLGLDQVETRSSRVTVLDEQTRSETTQAQSGFAKSTSWQGWRVYYDYLRPTGITQVPLAWSAVAKRSLKQFSTWEFYIPRPTGIGDRLSGYDKAAQALLGEGASLGTAYDLAPWSWLVDWYADVGGVIHYQQAIADNQVASRSGGWSLYDSVHYEVVPLGMQSVSSPGSWVSNEITARPATADFIRHTRRSGSPYSIGPTWDFSSQQWAILSALGVSRGR